MSHGGARPGSGRRKGGANKFNDEARAKAAAGGMLPLDYLLGLLRNENETQEVRIDVAKAAAPYLHARLAAIEHSGDDEHPFKLVVEWQKQEES
jgi:hypothetical protein